MAHDPEHQRREHDRPAHDHPHRAASSGTSDDAPDAPVIGQADALASFEVQLRAKVAPAVVGHLPGDARGAASAAMAMLRVDVERALAAGARWNGGVAVTSNGEVISPLAQGSRVSTREGESAVIVMATIEVDLATRRQAIELTTLQQGENSMFVSFGRDERVKRTASDVEIHDRAALGALAHPHRNP